MFSTEFGSTFESFPSIKTVFIGCFSADKIPKKIKPNTFVVLNTDISTGGGIHWYVVYRYSTAILEVFDSLGIDEKKKDFLEQHLKIRGVKEIEFNTTVFQKNDTDSCGKFVVYFIINRLFNLDHSFRNILEELFVENLDTNEKLVESFYEEITTN